MNAPPAVLHLSVTTPDRRPVRLWLPLFLLWPLGLALGAVALVLTILVDVVLVLLGKSYHHYTILLVRSLAALCEIRGMHVRFKDKEAAVEMTVQ